MSFRQDLSAFHEFARFCANLPDPTNCYQDWPLAYWIAARPNVNLAYIDAPLFRYRMHAANHSGDSRTPERALRNFNRTRNTLDAIVRIAHHSCVDAQSRKFDEERLTFSKAQVKLYSGRRTAALLGFFRSIPLLVRTGEIGKEVVRFAIGATLGPVAITRILARRKSKSFPDAVFVERSDPIEPQ